MILAEKIVELRKKMGWSQEELAEQLDVSRQSVSKWESAQSVPDMDKIVKMSSVFGVTTDYLLKDEMGEPEVLQQPQDSEPGLRKVSLAQASEYMEKRRKRAPLMAISAFLCVASPIVLILLCGMSEGGPVKISEGAAVGTGLCVLLTMIAIAVVGFIRCASEVSDFAFLDNEDFETEYGVSGLVKKNREAFKETATRINTICTVLCILASLPLLVTACFGAADYIIIICVCILLAVVACAVQGFVYAGTINGSFSKLLEEGEFNRQNKARSGKMNAFSGVYWMLAVAASMTMMFLGVNLFWIVYPIAGVLFYPARVLFSAICKD